MSNGIITFKIMPESPDSNCETIKEQALKIAKDHGSKGEMQAKIEPLAFGLQQILIYAMYEMNDGKDFDEIKDDMAKIEDVSTVEIINMDLAMG